MPIYLWKCEHCQAVTQVIRKVKDIEVGPGEPDDDKVVTECRNGDLVKENPNDHNWVRIPAATSFKLIGIGWFGSGGY